MNNDLTLDRETAQIMSATLASLLGREVIIIELGSDVTVHQHTSDSVMPQTTYSTKREAASRVLQLLGIGPVAPQTWPETAYIGEVS